MNVSAVIVTRGDVNLAKIWEEGLADVVSVLMIWDNSREQDLSVYGRYAAIERCSHDVILVQDDDCLLPPESLRALIDAYEPGVLVANMPEPFRAHYSDSCLVGFGAIFDRDLPAKAFNRFANYVTVNVEPDPWLDREWRLGFDRTCDVVFTTLTPFRLLDLPYENMPWATGPDRMYRSPTHVGERARMLDLARQVRDAR